MSNRTRKFLIALSSSLLFSATRVQRLQANPAVIAPVACTTGVGCILIGTAAIGGLLYYVWQHQQSGQSVQFEASLWEPGDDVAVYDRERCYKIAQKYRKTLVKIEEKTDVTGKRYFLCKYKS